MTALSTETQGENQDTRLIPLSVLQHYAFCPRQCALIHNEQVWAENYLTAQGKALHERVDSGEEFGRCLEVRVRRRWWRVFGRAGRLKTRRGRGGGFAYTTARPQRRFAPSFLPNTSLGRKAEFRPSGRVWACLAYIPQVSDDLFFVSISTKSNTPLMPSFSADTCTVRSKRTPLRVSGSPESTRSCSALPCAVK